MSVSRKAAVKRTLIELAAAGLVSGLLLTGCGGGGGGGGSTTASSALGGTAAVGSPIADGAIAIKCAAGSALATTTGSMGEWQVALSGQTLPCAVRVSGGTIAGAPNTTPYHSIATSLGTVNVTPLTDLVVANMAGDAPGTWFSGLGPAKFAPITPTNVDAALNRVRDALALAPLNTINPITTAFTPIPGDSSDNLLAALKAAMVSTSVTHDALLGNASTPAFAAPAGLGTAMATAYAGLPNGGVPSSGSLTGMTLVLGLQGYSGGFVPAGAAGTFDLMVGAPGATNKKGALLIYKSGETVPSSAIQGAAQGDYFGSSFASLGNVTSAIPGKNYFAVGAVHATGNAPLSGAVYVYERTAVGGTLVAVLRGDQALDRFGFAITSGDLNADGINDIVVVAPYTYTSEPGDTTSGFQSGATYVYFGGAALSAKIAPDVKIQGATSTTPAIGDVNGDGIADLLAPASGKVRVFFGGTDFQARVGAPDVVANAEFTAGGNAVAYLGDVNGDGLGDVAVSNTGAKNAANAITGAVYIYRGSATLSGTLAATAAAASIWGASEFDKFGSSIALVGEATQDILVGASWAAGGALADSGNIYRFSLAPATIPLVSGATLTTADATQSYPIGLMSGEYGRNLAIGGHMLFAGAHLLDRENGVAYLKDVDSGVGGGIGGGGGGGGGGGDGGHVH